MAAEEWEPSEWDVHGVGTGTDPMELAAVVFEYAHQHHGPMEVRELRTRFPRMPKGTFDRLLAAAGEEGLIRVQRRFQQTGLVFPLRMN